MRTKCRLSQGFSLVEISIVLAVLSVVLSGMLPYMTESTKSVDTDETEERLDAIEEALVAYYASQQSGDSALPCPASMTIKVGEANFGTAAANPGQTGRCTGGTPAANYSSGFLRGGAVPVRDLGLPDEFAFDGWGRRIFYIVDYRATGTDPSSNPSDWNNAGAITIQDGSGGSRTTQAVYALVSTGPNGHGGYTRSGNRVNTGSTNTHEIENCGISAATPCNDAFDTVLVKKNAQYDTPGVTTDYFDDIVRYKDTRLIDRVTSGLAGDKLWSRAATGKIQAADTADSVGIGNTNPAAKLHVTGDQVVVDSTTTTEGGQVLLGGPTDAATSDIALDNYQGRFRIITGNGGSTERVTVLQNGNMGLGTTNPTSKLEVLGNASISSGLTVSAGGANIAGGNLSVGAGTVTSSGNITTSGGHFLRGAANISNIPTCDVNTQKVHWNGSAWSCQTLSGGSGAGELDPKVGTTANTYVCAGTGSQVNCASSGPRVSGQELWATLFRDMNNGSYYVDPASTSIMNDVRALIYYDQNNTGYYMRPSSVSVMNDVRAYVYYDQGNTGYYMVPRSTSRMNYVVFDNTYTYGNGNYNDIYIRAAGRWASQLDDETDPQVGGLTNGKWCRASGGAVVCDQDAPSGGSGGCHPSTGAGCGCGGTTTCSGSCSGGDCYYGDDDFDEAATDLLFEKLLKPEIAQAITTYKRQGKLH